MCEYKVSMSGWGSGYIGLRFQSTYRASGMTKFDENLIEMRRISTHIPLVRYDDRVREMKLTQTISTHISLARYDQMVLIN